MTIELQQEIYDLKQEVKDQRERIISLKWDISAMGEINKELRSLLDKRSTEILKLQNKWKFAACPQ